ncbi:MAG TPA: hypothetical protein VHQ23_09625 [Ilumatobacteraceae bacterium]|nr:hypothetical protein [Ilumatobacteraceae bacterium]
MGDQDWLDKGHGAGEGLQPMIKRSAPHAFDRVSIRSVLRGTDAPKPRNSRRNKALVGWLLYCATAVGGTAAAFTVRDTLFPALGAPTDNRVWPNPDTTLTTEHGSASTDDTRTTVTPTTLAATTLAAAAEAPTVPTVAGSSQGPGNSIDNSGPGAAGPGPNAGTGSGTGPAPGTTVDENQARGQGPGPGTTVADNPSDTSTPSSASTPTSAPGTPTSPAPADGDTSPGHQSGKGGGSGGGGGGGGGGGSNPSTP